MYIRLVLPKCKEPVGLYCNDSHFYQDRLDILEDAFREQEIDIVITSNNFFLFHHSCLADKEFYVHECIIPLVNTLPNKKNLIIGFDLDNIRINFNPYGGIPSLVTCLYPENNIYKLHAVVWECWNSCDINCFISQPQRIVKFKEKFSFCLLSCGDMLFTCNNQLKKLNVSHIDAVIVLAHMKMSQNILRAWQHIITRFQKITDLLIITQQISPSGNPFSNNSYKLIWNSRRFVNVKQRIINKSNYYFVDLLI